MTKSISGFPGNSHESHYCRGLRGKTHNSLDFPSGPIKSKHTPRCISCSGTSCPHVIKPIQCRWAQQTWDKQKLILNCKKELLTLKVNFSCLGFHYLQGVLFLFQLMLQSSPHPVTVFLEVQKVVPGWRYKFFWKVSLGDDLVPNHLLLASTACPLWSENVLCSGVLLP